MAYNSPPKQDITGYLVHLHELTDKVRNAMGFEPWTNSEFELIWADQPSEMSPQDFLKMMYIAAKRGLEPLLRQIYGQVRGGKCGVECTIDGFRLLCDRTKEVDGMSEPRFNYLPDANGQPYLSSCTISLYRKSCSQPFTHTAFLNEFAQKDRSGNITSMWAKMPHQMLAKCTEACVRRIAFAEALSGLYIAEEMMQADNPQVTTQPNLNAAAAVVAPAWQPAPVVSAPAPEQSQPQSQPQPEIQPARRGRSKAQEPVQDRYVCAEKGCRIEDWTDPSSKQTFSRDWLYENAMRSQFMKPLCASCWLELTSRVQAQPKPPVSAQQSAAAHAEQILNGHAA